MELESGVAALLSTPLGNVGATWIKHVTQRQVYQNTWIMISVLKVMMHTSVEFYSEAGEIQ